MKKFLGAVVITAAFCITLVWIAKIGAGTALAVKNKGHVGVKGFASQIITSDLGIFEVTLSARSEDLKLAYAKLAEDRDAFVSYISGYDISPAAIGAAPVQVEERNRISDSGHTTNEIAFYIVNQSFRVESKDVAKIARIASEAGDLLGRGITAMIRPPQYLFTGLEDLKIEMIGKAASNARGRAEALAKNGRFRLGSIADVRVGVFQITPLHSTEVADYGINDTSSIEKEIKSVVDVRFFVK